MNYDASLPAQIRKEQGIFYSPDAIAQSIVNEAIDIFLIDKNEKNLPDIRLLDPACGVGIFLQASLEILLY
jgi:type I restriction-modification system DNA methylase subunit